MRGGRGESREIQERAGDQLKFMPWIGTPELTVAAGNLETIASTDDLGAVSTAERTFAIDRTLGEGARKFE